MTSIIRSFVFITCLTITNFAFAQTTQSSTIDPTLGQGKVIGLDYFFNHQIQNGKQFHYVWEDTKNSGYSKFGDVWKEFGASLAKIENAPTRKDLDRLSVFIIVNPSTITNAADHKPNIIDSKSIDTIADWVHDGGVLALFGNDKNNNDLEHLTQLSQKFGITFNNDLRNAVPDRSDAARAKATFTAKQFPDHPLFRNVGMIYMKEISTLQVTDPAQSLLVADKESGEGKDIIMATSHYGKGLVFAVGDPWIYNEYIDLKTPGLPIENRKAAENLVGWLLGAALPK